MDIVDTVLCALEEHPETLPHSGIIRYLNLHSPGEIWAHWTSHRPAPYSITHRQDCPHLTCASYSGHRGRHSSQLSRP